MASKSKGMVVRKKPQVMDNPVMTNLANSELPESYQRLLGLIFFSHDPLIHKVKSYDKISS